MIAIGNESGGSDHKDGSNELGGREKKCTVVEKSPLLANRCNLSIIAGIAGARSNALRERKFQIFNTFLELSNAQSNLEESELVQVSTEDNIEGTDASPSF